MKAQDIMTANPACCAPNDTAERAAQLMSENDCGCAPVVEDQETRRLLGVITDRDIALRGVAQGRGADTPVRDLMSEDVSCCTPESDVRDVQRIMAERQVRRVPVIDEGGCCIGMVSQADLARHEDTGISDREVGRTVERISEPTRQERSESGAGRTAPPTS